MQLNKLAATAIVAGMLLPAFAFADTATSSIQTLLDQIKALQQQIVELQQQQQQNVAALVSTLKQGDVGANVTLLQQLLAQDTSIFPEGKITGFFGKLTAQAVKRFQKRHGLDQVGDVGPKTLKKLNELFGHFDTSAKSHGDEQGDDNDNDKHKDDRPCDDNNGKHSGWFIGLGNIKDDHEHPCTAASTPDTIAPVISNISAIGITTTSAAITWTTNEAATSKVYYGTTTPLVLATALTSSNASLLTAHSLALSGLTVSTTVYFVVESKDAANNAATTSTQSFVTTN